MKKPKPKLLAPNGQPSNLTAEQYRLVRTPAFKAWFGDWENEPENSSKVVDENGEPLRVYHKTDYKFTVFDKEKLGSTSNWNTAYFGFYFSNIYERTSYGRLSIKCFLNIRNPYLIECEMYCDYDYDYKRFDESNFSKNDGIIIKTMKLGKDEKADKHFVAFEPNQIKLADGTNTTFDSNNPDIRFDEGGRVTFDQYTSQGIKKAYVSIRIRYESGRAADDKFYNKYELTSFDEKPFEELKDHKLKGILGVSTSNYNLSEWLVHRECLVVMPFDKFKELNDTEQIQYYDADYLSKNGFDALHRLFNHKERTDNDYTAILQKIFREITQELHLEGMSMSQGSEYTNIYVIADWFNIYNSSKFTKYVANQKRINSPEELAQIVIDYANSEQSKIDYSYNRQTENLSIESIIQPIIRGIVQSGKIYVDESEWLIKNKELVIPENSQLFFVIKDYENMRDKYEEYISRYNLASSYKIAFINQKNLNELQSKRWNLKTERSKEEFEKAKTFTQKRIVKAIQKIQNDVIEEWTNKLIEEFKESYSNEVFKDYDGNSYSDNILEVPSAIIYFDSLMLKFIDIYDARVDYIAQTKSKYAFSDIFNDFSDYIDRLRSQEGEEELEVKTSYNRVYKYDILQKLYYYARHSDYEKFGQQIKSQIGSDLYRYFSKGEVGFKNGGLTMKKVLLAPNGKPTNLTPEQYRLVRTPAFKAWFGDWENSPETASKVVDFNGEPLVVYHATNKFFYKFNNEKSKRGVVGSGFYFTPNKNIAKDYGKIVLSFFIKITSPLIIKDESYKDFYKLFGGEKKYYKSMEDSISMDEFEKNLSKQILSFGYNGVCDYTSDEIVAFKANQIKLADGTNTTFDSNNPDIRYAEGGELTLSSEQVENKLGRKLDWWNDDIVYLSGTEYKKVYLRPEYKKVIE